MRCCCFEKGGFDWPPSCLLLSLGFGVKISNGYRRQRRRRLWRQSQIEGPSPKEEEEEKNKMVTAESERRRHPALSRSPQRKHFAYQERRCQIVEGAREGAPSLVGVALARGDEKCNVSEAF